MNRKGADKIISVYWFTILFIVAAGIVYMAVLFYGAPYDVREIEANVLINKVADCLSRDGQLVEYDLSNCNLNFNVEDYKSWEKQEQYYVGVSGLVVDEKGNSDLAEYCGKEGDKIPVCVEREFYTLDGTKGRVIKITSVVRKTEKNVR